MRRDRCETCKFHDALRLTCRKGPPSLVAIPTASGQVQAIGAWPPADKTDWCGEHKPEDEPEEKASE